MPAVTPCIGEVYGEFAARNEDVLLCKYEIVGVCPSTLVVTPGPWKCTTCIPRSFLEHAKLLGKGDSHETAVTLGDLWRRPTGDTVQIVGLVDAPSQLLDGPETITYLVPKTGDLRTARLSRMYEESWVRVGPGWGTGIQHSPAAGQRWRLDTGLVVELVQMGTSFGYVSGRWQVPLPFDPTQGVYLGRQCRWKRTALIPGTVWQSNTMCATITGGTPFEVHLKADKGWDFTMNVEKFREHFRPEPSGPAKSRYEVLLESDEDP